MAASRTHFLFSGQPQFNLQQTTAPSTSGNIWKHPSVKMVVELKHKRSETEHEGHVGAQMLDVCPPADFLTASTNIRHVPGLPDQLRTFQTNSEPSRPTQNLPEQLEPSRPTRTFQTSQKLPDQPEPSRPTQNLPDQLRTFQNN